MRYVIDILILFFYLTIMTGTIYSQTNVNKEKYYLNPVLINPAMSGSEFHPVLNMSVSKRWMGISESPSIQMISTSLRMGNFDFYNPKMFLNKTNLKTYEKVGLGITAYNYIDGPESAKGVQMAYAYHIALRKSRLSFGLSGTYNSNTLNGSLFNPVTPIDPLIDYSKEGINRFNMNFGSLYYTSDYFLGLSVLNLIPSKNIYQLAFGDDKRDFWLQGGYIFKDINSFMIEPSVFLNYNEINNLSYDIFAKLYFLRLNWLALGYHSRNAFSIKTGLRTGLLYLAYSFELSLSKIAKYSVGTHEIGIGLNIGTRRLEGF